MLNSRSRKGAGQCERMHSPAFLSRLRGEMERPDPPRPGVPLFWIRFCAGRRIASRPFPHSAKTVTCPPHRRDRFKSGTMSPGRFGTGTIARSAFSGSRMPLKIATWNVNSVRQRLAHLERFCGLHAPDVVCLQEIKVSSADFPAAAVAAFGYPYIEVHGRKRSEKRR